MGIYFFIAVWNGVQITCDSEYRVNQTLLITARIFVQIVQSEESTTLLTHLLLEFLGIRKQLFLILLFPVLQTQKSELNHEPILDKTLHQP